ncbi:spindle pole body component 110 [Ceratitis capitata]|nr:spindle pole body component 110 [Ceratitis capitata]
MDDDQKYKLITCVDPRKVNVPIRDRFAKLTLSNKKKQQVDIDTAAGQICDKEVMAQVKRVSRNLLETLGTENTADNKCEFLLQKTLVAPTLSNVTDIALLDKSTVYHENYMNRSLCKNTVSDPTCSNIENTVQTEVDSDNSDFSNRFLIKNLAAAPTVSNLTDICYYVNPLLRSDSSGSDPMKRICSEVDIQNSDKTVSDCMQPLQVSQSTEENLPECDISILTNRISGMTMNHKNLENEKKPIDTTLLISTESQQRNTDFESNRLLTCTKSTNGDENVLSISGHPEATCISLSSTDDNGSAITVTDSSISELLDLDFMTSDIPESGHTLDAFLPNTFSNEKADRMEAFLRDVSQQRREYEEIQKIEKDKFHLHVATVKNSPKTDKNNARVLGGLAYADTESMTTFSTEQRRSEECNEFQDCESKNQFISIKNERRMGNDTLSMSQFQSEDFQICDIPNNHKNNQITDEETQVNTNTSGCLDRCHSTQENEEEYSLACSEQSSISDASKSDVPDDSVIISETSSENLSSHSVHDSRYSSNEVVNTEQSIGVDTESEQLTPPVMSIGSINISAKINIKISISQMDSMEEECENDAKEKTKVDYTNNDSGEENDMSSENDYNEKTPTQDSNNQEFEKTCHSQKQDRTYTDPVDPITSNNLEKEIPSEEEEDVNFLTQAERLLNQVYGTSWKTPEVIRTLKRTSRTPKKADSTQSPQASNIREHIIEDANLVGSADKSVGLQLDQNIEQSVLDDFSTFRHNIVRTNLDSTRFTTPNLHKEQAASIVDRNNYNSEPRCKTKPHTDFKVPKTEIKRKVTAKQQKCNDRWRQLIDKDSDTSGDNASDDLTLDKTEHLDDSLNVNKKNKSETDKEWSLTSDDSDDSDYKIKQPKKVSTIQRRNQKQEKKSAIESVGNSTRGRQVKAKSRDNLIYLDLSKDEVTIQEGEPNSPKANTDANFKLHLEDILRTCKATDKAKISVTPNTGGKTKRKLFTANFGEEDVDLTVGEDGVQPRTPVRRAPTTEEEEILHDMEQVKQITGVDGIAIFNKHLESVKRGGPIFKATPPRMPDTPKSTVTPVRIKHTRTLRERNKLDDQIIPTPQHKYGFLKSLDVCVAKSLCHPEALSYRENYRTKKEELANLLYELYNEKLFDKKLHAPLKWNKKLCNTAGRCLNKKKLGVRTSVIELSEKVLTSADRLRCTLIHELCHAATWIFNGEGGHGSTWKQWALKANQVFPEIPKIGVCHQYEIEYKYTYKCTLCAAKSHAHSKSKKVENIRCSYCHGAIEIFLNRKDKDGNVMSTPVREAKGFAKFVKDNYKQHKRPDLKHADVMKILSSEFAALKLPD